MSRNEKSLLDDVDDRVERLSRNISRKLSSVKGMDGIYDVNTFRFKNVIFPVLLYGIIMFIVMLWGMWNDVPGFLFISYHGLAIAVACLVHDHWILNSMTIALVPPYTIVAAVDIISLNGAMGWHVPLIAIAIAVCFRRNASFGLMVVSTIWYVFWIYCIKRWIDYPYYDCSFTAPWEFICDYTIQSLALLITGVLFSAGISWKNHILKSRGKKMDCPDGACPW